MSPADFPHFITARIVSQALVACQSRIRSTTLAPPFTQLELGLVSLKHMALWKRKDSSQAKEERIMCSN